MYAKMESIGLKAGAAWDPTKLDPAALKAFNDGIADARLEFKKRSEAQYDPCRFY